MSSLLTAITTIISLLYGLARLSRDVVSKFTNFKKHREIKKDYKQGEQAVRDGNVEKINEIIRSK